MIYLEISYEQCQEDTNFEDLIDLLIYFIDCSMGLQILVVHEEISLLYHLSQGLIILNHSCSKSIAKFLLSIKSIF